MSGHFELYLCKICHGLSLWETFCFIFMVQIFCIVFELCKYYKIPQIQNGRLAAILKLFPLKG